MFSTLTENYLPLLFGSVFVLVVLVCLLFWYARQMVIKLLFITENIEDLLTLIKSYSVHLKSVYGLETFYGDETMHSLLKHTGHIIKELEQYETVEQLTEDKASFELNDQEA